MLWKRNIWQPETLLKWKANKRYFEDIRMRMRKICSRSSKVNEAVKEEKGPSEKQNDPLLSETGDPCSFPLIKMKYYQNRGARHSGRNSKLLKKLIYKLSETLKKYTLSAASDACTLQLYLNQSRVTESLQGITDHGCKWQFNSEKQNTWKMMMIKGLIRAVSVKKPHVLSLKTVSLLVAF